MCVKQLPTNSHTAAFEQTMVITCAVCLHVVSHVVAQENHYTVIITHNIHCNKQLNSDKIKNSTVVQSCFTPYSGKVWWGESLAN